MVSSPEAPSRWANRAWTDEWECESLDELVRKPVAPTCRIRVRPSVKVLLAWLKSTLVRPAEPGEAVYNIGRRHYDLGNDLYRLMLDKGMNLQLRLLEAGEEPG